MVFQLFVASARNCDRFSNLNGPNPFAARKSQQRNPVLDRSLYSRWTEEKSTAEPFFIFSFSGRPRKAGL